MIAAAPWGLLSVELVVCAWILVMLAADLLLPQSRKASLWLLALLGIAAATACLLQQSASPQETFQSVLRLDPFSRYFKGLFLLTTAIVIVMTKEFRRHLHVHVGAFYMLLFTALLGTLILASVNDFLLLFLGLELLTFSLYIMAAYLRTDTRSVEAGMKYLILGSVSSGFLVYGIALLYGFAGSTNFSVIQHALGSGTIPVTAQAGMFLIFAGLGFKVAAVPFHLWVPDVYEGAPTPVVAFLSVGSKMAGIVAMLRILYGVFASLSSMWAAILALLSAATMLYGNLAAIPQTNIKRLLGYSSIGHAGYLLMGLSTVSAAGVTAVGYYLLAYLFSNLAVFFVVIAASDAIGGETLDDYKGLSKRSGVLAGALFIGLLSLAGVPPLAGFIGKLLVLLATVESGQLWLAAIGAVNVAISLYYYLMIVKRMYLDAPSTTAPIALTGTTKIVLAFLVFGILMLGIVQQPFLQHIASALQF